MYQSIFYKEWIKTRKITGLLFIVFVGLIVYSFIEIMQQFRSSGAVPYWETIIQKDLGLFPIFNYVPVLSGILFAITQYIPEMQNKRLKLTLHLPLSENRILSAMLVYGFVVIFLLLTITFAIMMTGLNFYFAKEIVVANILNCLPWFLGGIAGYLITAWICLEPVWKQRVFNVLSGLFALSFFIIKSKSGAYIEFFPVLILLIILFFLFSFFSVARFKEGAQ